MRTAIKLAPVVSMPSCTGAGDGRPFNWVVVKELKLSYHNGYI